MNFSKVIFEDKIKESTDRILSILNSISEADGSIIRGNANSIYVSKRTYIILNELYQSSVGIDSMIAGMLLECVHEAEKRVPGSGAMVIKLIVGPRADLENKSYDDISPTVLRRSDIVGLLSSLSFSSTITDIVTEASSMAGMTGKIFIDVSKTNDTLIELKSGYNFSLLLPIGPFYGEKKWEKNWCKCFLIDGVIETLGEIDGLLQDASKEKEPVTIFARGFSSDVISTIKVNNDRQTIDVMLVSFGVDNLKTLNTIADVAAAVGTDIVSPMKGDLIAGVKFYDLRSVEKIICSNGTVTIINERARPAVLSHVNDLTTRASAEHHEIAKLLNERIRSLSSTCVLISVSKLTAEINNITIEELDMALNVLRSAANWGVTISNDTGQERIVPAAGASVSKRYASIFLDNINKLSVAIIKDGST